MFETKGFHEQREKYVAVRYENPDDRWQTAFTQAIAKLMWGFTGTNIKTLHEQSP